MRPAAILLPLAGTVVFILAACVLIWADRDQPAGQGRAPDLELRVTENKGRIRVDWDPSAPAVKSATSAKLIARDGNSSHEYPVNGEALRGGGLDYLRRTNDVLLTLRIEETGAEAAVRSIVAQPPPPPPTAARKQTRTRSRSRRR